MQFWFVCFLLLFFSAEGLQWLGQMSWMSGVDLSLPLVIVGGLGLAIASNASTWKALGKLTAAPPRSDVTPESAPPEPPPSPPVIVQTAPKKPSTSISFEIHKPHR